MPVSCLFYKIVLQVSVAKCVSHIGCFMKNVQRNFLIFDSGSDSWSVDYECL